ncbi:MAG: prephenate dehydrogenase/arogenate dehydrogenase family protein [bacterium]
MQISSISILGLGLIGGSLAKSIKQYFPDIQIFGFDTVAVLKQAEYLDAIDDKLLSPLDALNSDIIFLCMPVDYSLELFRLLIPRLKDSQIISDVCSVKAVFADIWKQQNSKGIYIGGHPMTGKEKGGFENSDPLLFENSVYILTSQNQPEFLNIINKIGARITFLDPYLHDKVVSVVSHLPQLLSVSLVNFAGQNEGDVHYLNFAAGGFRDMTRIASSGFSIWDSIITYNRTNIINAADLFIAKLEELKNLLVNEKTLQIKNTFESARIIRDEIPKTSKGFLFPLYEIYVYVKDEPGVVSKISTVLYSNGINIKDIELLKIREGAGGTFRLSFETEEDAKNAQQLVQTIGYSTK